MKTTLIALPLLCVMTGVCGDLQRAQVDVNRLPTPKPHHQPEYTFDTSTDAGGWSKQPKGLRVAFGSTDQSYFRCEPPGLDQEAPVWTASGWRGERLNAQILVWSSEAQEQVRFEIGDLRSERGQIIERSAVRLQLVRYVVSNLPYEAAEFTCDATNDLAWLLPDRLERLERFDLPARTLRPVWLSLDVPNRTEPGAYAGAIDVRSLGNRATLQVKVKVQPLVLPDPRHWKFRLDLWQNPWVLAAHFQVAPWSDAHKALLREHLKLYAEAGGKFITTYSTHSPWSDNSYVLEGTMIDWTKTRDGGWRFDYSIFDQYVELAMDAGIDKAITIYTPVPWGHRFRYLDEASGHFVTEQWPPQSDAFRSFWNVFLDDLKAHLVTKGWFQKTYLGINENPLEITLAAAKVIKDHSPDWKITYAGNWHPELSSLLDDYSVIITSEPSEHELQQRSVKGFTTTFYVCCNPPRPNNFVFSAPVEGRFIGWHAAARKYDGFLRWAYDAWPVDPNRDARHNLWPAGDCFLVYPGASSSIRFEKLREGIADFEKIAVLREKAVGSTNENAKKQMEELDRYLTTVAGDRDYSKRDYTPAKLSAVLERGNRLIEDLTRELAK